MNQDQVKQQLLEIHKPTQDFTLIFSGKSSKTYNGCYHPEKQEIVIHNKNFIHDGTLDENAMMYTAIHEFAHHVRELRGPISKRNHHDNEFKAIFNDLLKIAIKKGIYNDDIFNIPELTELTKTLKEDYIAKNAALMKEFGGLLNKAFQICLDKHLRFDQYCTQVLQFKVTEATTLININAQKLPDELGLDQMKMIATIKNEAKREMVQNALLEGEPIEKVKTELIDKPKPQNTRERLLIEKEELLHRIASLQRRLSAVEDKINTIDENS